MEVFFSVIIPLFNKEESIISTVNSVLVQTCSEFELIIVNDGSTDGSLNQLAKIKDKRVKIISKVNGGVSSARNLGINAALGNYIAFLDADDLWYSNYLATMRTLILDFPRASFFGCQIIYKSGVNNIIINSNHNKRGVLNYFENSIIAPTVSSSSIIIDKSCFKKIGLFDTSLSRGEDLDFWWRLAKNFQLAFEPQPMVIYVQDSSNRACQHVQSLRNYFLPNELSSMSSSEKKYAIKLIGGIVYEMAINKKVNNLLLLFAKYNFYAINIYWKLFTKGILKLRENMSW